MSATKGFVFPIWMPFYFLFFFQLFENFVHACFHQVYPPFPPSNSFPISPDYSSRVHGCRGIYRVMGNFSGATSLKKADSLSLSSHLLSKAPQLGVGLCDHLLPPGWFCLAWSCSCRHSPCHCMCTCPIVSREQFCCSHPLPLALTVFISLFWDINSNTKKTTQLKIGTWTWTELLNQKKKHKWLRNMFLNVHHP